MHTCNARIIVKASNTAHQAIHLCVQLTWAEFHHMPGGTLQVADEYGSEAYRGAIDLTVHDPTGKQIHYANAIQDDEISVDAHGVKVGAGLRRNLYRSFAASPPHDQLTNCHRKFPRDLVAPAAACWQPGAARCFIWAVGQSRC
jgi:hypothetical protein